MKLEIAANGRGSGIAALGTKLAMSPFDERAELGIAELNFECAATREGLPE
jgi:hypothetical protein